MATDNNEATAWNAGLGGGNASAPAPCKSDGALTHGQSMAVTVGACLAGFVTGVLANSGPKK